MSDRSSTSLPLRVGASSSSLLEKADGDAAHILGLLAQAQALLHSDLMQANLYLDRVCELLRRGAPLHVHSSAFLPKRFNSHRPPPIGGLASWQLRKVTAHIESWLGRNLVTEELALVASLSPGHFCRAFKVSMGETPHAYVIRQRIRRAQRLMLETSHSLSDIASACGLTDQAHLTRLFKRLVGTTPLSWRRTWQGAVLPA